MLDLGFYGIGEPDGGGAVVPCALVTGSFDPVCVVPSELGGAGACEVPPPGVEVLVPGDAGHDTGQGGPGLLRGKAGPTARCTIRTVRVNLTRSGSIPAAVAAAQIKALIA